MACLAAPSAWCGSCCCHTPLSAIKCRPTWQFPQQDSRPGEVAALSLPQVKPPRPPAPVTDHGSLAGHVPLWRHRSRGMPHSLVEAGRRGMGFDIGGIHHQHLFYLCAIGSCQPGEDQLNTTLSLSDQRRQRLQRVLWGPSTGGASTQGRPCRSTWDHAAQHLAVVHPSHATRFGEEGLDALKLALTEPKDVGRSLSS